MRRRHVIGLLVCLASSAADSVSAQRMELMAGREDPTATAEIEESALGWVYKQGVFRTLSDQGPVTAPTAMSPFFRTALLQDEWKSPPQIEPAGEPFPSLNLFFPRDPTPPPSPELDPRLDPERPVDRRALAVTSTSGYFNLELGRTAFGGGVQLDLSLPITETGTWMIHAGGGFNSISRQTLAAYTFDLSKLATLDGTALGDRWTGGLAVDLFSAHGSLDRSVTATQIRGSLGWRVNPLLDVGLLGIWPTSSEIASQTELLFEIPPDFLIFQTTSQRFEFTRQVRGYGALSLTDRLEAIIAIGHRTRPDAFLFQTDLAWMVTPNSDLITGVTTDTRGAVAWFLGLQMMINRNRLVETGLRGGHHRLTGGGVFKTLHPSEGNLYRNSAAPVQVNQFQVQVPP